jgi:hypothetical protein
MNGKYHYIVRFIAYFVVFKKMNITFTSKNAL